MNFDLGKKEVTVSIKEFPSDIQAHLLSTLDVNGFISNEPKFREIVAENLGKLPGLTTKEARRLYSVIKFGNLLPLFRDAEKNQFGLNFSLNTYVFSLDVLPGKPEMTKQADIDIAKALGEVAKKTTEDINRDTAYTWASRAMACYKLMHEADEEKAKDALNLRAEDFRHEALEHAALVGDASFAKEIHDLMERSRSVTSLTKASMPLSPVEVISSSAQPPVEKVQMDGRTYSIRVFESDPYKPIGNWTLDVSEDDSLIFRTTIVRWPGQGADIIDSYVLTDEGSWQDADSDDVAAISKLKDAMIAATRKYEEWSISRGPKSDMMPSEEWKEYKKLHGIEKDATKIEQRQRNQQRREKLRAERDDYGGHPYPVEKGTYKKDSAKEKSVFIDFDGTITNKAFGKKADTLMVGAKEALQKFKADGYKVIIYSVRANTSQGMDYIKEFLTTNDIPFDAIEPKPDYDFFIDNKAVSIGPNKGWDKVMDEVKTREQRRLDRLEKEGAFMPSLPGQPFWGQYGQGEDHSDYSYPLENLYPSHTQQPEGEPETEDYQDTSSEYANIPGKRKPGWMWQLFKKFMPVGREGLEKMAADRPALTYRDPDIDVAPSQLAFEIEVPKAPGSDQSFKCKVQAELTAEGAPPKTTEEDSEIIYKPLSDKEYKSISTDVRNVKKVIYNIKFVEAEGGPDVSPGTIIATLDATDFFKYPHKKQNIGNDMKEWLIGKMSTPAVTTFLPKILDRMKQGSPENMRKDWETNMLRDIVSRDYVSAMAQVSPETPGRDLILKSILGWWFKDLYRNQKYDDILTIAKVHRLGEIDPKTKEWKPNTQAELYQEKVIGYMQQAVIITGLGMRPATADYADQVATILYGNDSFPLGSSIETKSKIIQRAGASFLEDFVKDKNSKKVKFAEQPYAVQLETFRKLASYKQGGENGLWAMWGNKAIPSSIRKLILQTLVGWYGVGGLWGEGGAKYILPPESDSATVGKENILSQALHEPELRQLAYALMVSEKLPYLPWTNDGKFVYDESMKERSKDQPSRSIPEWLIAQLNREPHWEYRSIIINKILKELPEDLVKEEEPIEFAEDGTTIVNKGGIAVKGKPIKGLEWFLNLALRDPSKSIRSVVRAHFKLPAEKVPSLPKPTEKYIEPNKQDSAETFIFNVEGLLSHREYAKAAEQLKAAKDAKDSSKWSKEIAALEKKIKDLNTLPPKKNTELEAEKDILLARIKTKYGERFKRAEDLRNLLDYAAKEFSQQEEPFSKLSIYRQVDIAKKILEIPQIVDTFLQNIKGETPAVEDSKEIQPELPLARTEDIGWVDENDMFKQGNRPLGGIELESRQPPTTWPLNNPQTGYGSAFPLGAKNDELLLKDVNQFIGRPRGKYKADFSFWRWLLSPKKDDSDIDGDDTSDIAKEDKEQVRKDISSAFAFARLLIEKPDMLIKAAATEEALLEKLKAGESLDSLLSIAEEHHFKKVVDAAWEMVKNKKTEDHEKVLDVYVRWNDIDALERAVDSLWASSAISRLIALKQIDKLESLYEVVHPSIQERIVLHLGELDDANFLTKALNNENENVRRQAVQWLAHHEHFDILKKHLEKEKDPKVIAEIDKQLALKGAAPFSKGLEQIREEEKAKGGDTVNKAIAALVDKAMKAFTRWEIYPSVRIEVLKNYTARPYYDWVSSQPSIDEDINEQLSKLPTIPQGKEALDDLKEILEKVPELELKQRKDWLAQQEELYAKEDDPAIKEKRRVRIEETKKILADAEKAQPEKALDLRFQVDNLTRLYHEAVLREGLIDNIKKSKAFKQEYPGKGLWADYQAYLKTFEDPKVIAKDLDRDAINAAEGLDYSEKGRANMVWKYTAPLREAYAESMNTLNECNEDLDISIYTPEVDAARADLSKELKKYLRLEVAWLKQMGAIEPHIVIDDEYYKLMAPIWTMPKTPSISPEYSKSLQLIPGGKVMKMRHDSRNPFRFKIEELEKSIKELDKKFFQDVVPKLSKADKKILEEGQKAQHRAEQILKKIKMLWPGVLPPGYNLSEGSELGALIKGDKFIEPAQQRNVLDKVRKEYDEERKELYERVKNMHELSEDDPKYIALKKDVEDFRGRYGVPPMGDNPDVNARRQWHIDSGTSPSIAEPLILPEVRKPKPLGILDRPQK